MNAENTPEEPVVAPQDAGTQSEQAAAAESAATPPQAAEATEERLYAGKYKSPEDMEKAYLESQSKMTQLAQEKARLESMQIERDLAQPTESAFDEDTTNFVKSVYAQEREREKVAEFVSKNAEKLADPVIRGAVKEIISEARGNGQYIDQNEALRLAESQIESRLSGKIAAAKASGEKEGMDIANKKEQLAGIGTAAGKTEVDPSKLNAKEYAEFYQLNRTN